MILDYSATLHMFSDREFFFKFKHKKTSHFVTVGSHNWVLVEERRSVFFQAHINNTYHDIILNDVLYLFLLGVSLVSLGTLQRNSMTVKSSANRLVIVLSDTDLFHTFMDGNQETLYHISGRQSIALVETD